MSGEVGRSGREGRREGEVVAVAGGKGEEEEGMNEGMGGDAFGFASGSTREACAAGANNPCTHSAASATSQGCCSTSLKPPASTRA